MQSYSEYWTLLWRVERFNKNVTFATVTTIQPLLNLYVTFMKPLVHTFAIEKVKGQQMLLGEKACISSIGICSL